MKKKIISILLVLVLVCGLSVSAFAAGPAQKAGRAAGAKAAVTGDPAQVSALLATVMTNRAALLTIESGNVTLASQLRTMLGDLKSSGNTVSEETLAALKDLQGQLKAIRDQFASTKGQLDALMASFKQYRQAKDFENAAAVLQQIITIQQSRIETKTKIGALEQQMIDLVSGISTAA